MIKLVQVETEGSMGLSLAFSDDSTARWSAADLIGRDTVMTRPLADPTYFARAFIEDGALACPNGFELSAASLHRLLAERGDLIGAAA